MKKKGTVLEVAVVAIGVMIVIVVGGYILYQNYLGPNALPNWFLNSISQFRYGQDWAKMQELQKEVNGILTCSGNTATIKSDIDNAIRTLPDSATYMLNRFNELKQEVDLNDKFCSASKKLEEAKFDGTNENEFFSKLDAAKSAFQQITGKAQFTAVVRAKENVDAINKIKSCDFKENECSPAGTRGYCIWAQKAGLIGTPKFECRPAVCDAAKTDESYCKAIEEKTKLCFVQSLPDANNVLKFRGCEPCKDISSCNDYGFDTLACTFDPCKKTGDCHQPKIGGRLLGCRPQNIGITCNDHNHLPDECAADTDNACFVTGDFGCESCFSVIECTDYLNFEVGEVLCGKDPCSVGCSYEFVQGEGYKCTSVI